MLSLSMYDNHNKNTKLMKKSKTPNLSPSLFKMNSIAQSRILYYSAFNFIIVLTCIGII